MGGFSGLWKALDTVTNIEVDPTIAGFVGKAVFLDKFVGDVGEVDAGVFKAVERGIDVKVADVKAGKAGAKTRENTVKDEFGKLKGSGWRANIARIANAISTDGEASAIGLVLVWLDFTHTFGVGDFFVAVTGDVVVCDDEEGVDALDAWARSGGIFDNALTEAAEFVGVGLVPNTLIFVMFSELTICKCLDGVEVKNGHGPV